MKKKFGLGFFALAAYVLCLLVTFPADRAFDLLRRYVDLSPAKVWVAGLEGTVWSGRAAELLVGGVACRKVEWSCQPLALLRGRLRTALRMQIESGAAHGVLSLGRREVVLEAVEANLPAALLARPFAVFGIGAGGMLSANLERLILREGRLRALDGKVVWSGALLTATQEAVLGDLKAELGTVEQMMQGKITDSGGPLQAMINLRLDQEGAYEVKGSLGARDRKRSAIYETLRLLGRPDKDGNIAVALAGKLPPFSYGIF